MNKSLKVYYFARINEISMPGIYNKIQHITHALRESGYDAESVIYGGVGNIRSIWRSMWMIFSRMILVRADVIIVRTDVYMPLLFFAMLWQRFRGCRIIVDVPTPIITWSSEIKPRESEFRIRAFLKYMLVYFGFPWSLYPANRILQYAPESRYFTLGLKNKIRLVANGIDTREFPERNAFPSWPTREFVMIGVATLADWHGFDRVIRGIAEYLSQQREGVIVPIFIIVGEGPARSRWVKLAEELGVADNICFSGMQVELELDRLYEKAHVAITSLGLYRKSLNMASSLKTREYVARGLPFVQAGYDLDFDPMPFFGYQVQNDARPINISELINWYGQINYNEKLSGAIRSYAERKLDYRIKTREMIE